MSSRLSLQPARMRLRSDARGRLNGTSDAIEYPPHGRRLSPDVIGVRRYNARGGSRNGGRVFTKA